MFLNLTIITSLYLDSPDHSLFTLKTTLKLLHSQRGSFTFSLLCSLRGGGNSLLTGCLLSILLTYYILLAPVLTTLLPQLQPSEVGTISMFYIGRGWGLERVTFPKLDSQYVAEPPVCEIPESNLPPIYSVALFKSNSLVCHAGFLLLYPDLLFCLSPFTLFTQTPATLMEGGSLNTASSLMILLFLPSWQITYPSTPKSSITWHEKSSLTLSPAPFPQQS